MNWTKSFKTAAAIASVSVFASISPAFAQEEAAEEKPAAETGVESASNGASAEKAFYPLLRCVRTEGVVQILKPGSKNWSEAEEGRFYPLGTVIRTAGDATAVFAFGEKALVILEKDSEFASRAAGPEEVSRAIVLKRGRVRLDLPRKLADGLFKVVAPNFECSNLAGESTFDYETTGDGDEVVVRCVTGTLALKGAHYTVPRMGAANQVRIRTTGDALFSSLRGESGDCHVLLDQGMVPERNLETGETQDVAKTLEFVLSPKCAIKIFRAKSAVSGRMSVSTMTFNAAGDMVNRRAFAEGLSSVNSGELVISPTVAAAAKASKDKDAEDEGEADEASSADKKDAEDASTAEKKEDGDAGL